MVGTYVCSRTSECVSQEEWVLLNKLARDQEQGVDMKRLVNTSDYPSRRMTTLKRTRKGMLSGFPMKKVKRQPFFYTPMDTF